MAARVPLLLGLMAAAALTIALILQYVFGYAPCHLCVLERLPWVTVVAAAAAAMTIVPRVGLLLAAVALLVGVGLSAYHVGVEQGWVALPASCVSGGAAGSLDELRAQLMQAGPTCDQVSVGFFGLSLVAWNGVASLAALALSLIGLRRPRVA